MDIGIGAIDTPLGRMVVAASDVGVVRLGWSEELENKSAVGRHHVETARKWVSAFFQRRDAPIPKLDRGDSQRSRERFSGPFLRLHLSVR